ncbi:MAG: type IV toxin-antitoxin system AbiEi family antitoxin domain-containing protein [Actinomycetota bacterium]|nr:type IV toxin-antitoxin system AbiEi family antitoxin domain-containing protein [Actinomycetota bacterium]MDK1039084.1 type IV toxin-antitoxin system AbiEi family antitoxin domain-containing protein [Actinomycetota bacterium]
MADADRLLTSMAKTQFGVFTRSQAIAAGVHPRSIGDRTSSGVYERLHPGVYGIVGTPEQWHRAVIAAVFAATEPAAASHRTAAYLWGMTDRCPDTVEIASRRHMRVKREDYQVRESKDLRSSDIVVVDGIPTTTAVRTIVDLGASAPPWLVERCLDTGLRKELFDIWDVQRFIMRVARKGRNGIGTIRPLVEERLTWKGITASDLEDLFRRVVAPLPYTMPEAQFQVFEANGDFVGRYDFAYPTRMAIIETDSEGFHMDSVSFQRDREKQNRAHALGWTVYRFTWRQLIDDPDAVRAIVTQIWSD